MSRRVGPGRVVLVTGGAGYIGSHVVRLLVRQGVPVVVVDDLSTGLVERVPGVPFVHLDVSAPEARGRLVRVVSEHAVTDVVHLAALKSVGDSVQDPTRYFDRNVGGLTSVLAAAESTGVERFVFSSSAAVYGRPGGALVTEADPCCPINPYGQTKLVGEWMTAASAAAAGLATASLRYFNVAGTGWPDLADRSVSNLVPIVVDAVREDRPVPVLGRDWDTADGSCVRDYVHVLDLARAHVAALAFLGDRGRGSWTFNLGTGVGASVLDVVRTVEEVAGRRAVLDDRPRRPGDPAVVVADASRARAALDWRPTASLVDVVTSTWEARLGVAAPVPA